MICASMKFGILKGINPFCTTHFSSPSLGLSLRQIVTLYYLLEVVVDMKILEEEVTFTCVII